MASFTERVIGAARLDVNTYEEVEADASATGQAMGVVLLSSIAAGIGGLGMGGGIKGVIVAAIGALIGWVVWAALTWFIGTKVLPEPQTEADMGQLLRTIGFASSPGILRLLGFVPILGWIVSLLAAVWMLVAMVIATRQALDYTSTGRAVAVCAIGFFAYLVVGVALAMMAMGVGGAMAGG